MLWKCCTHMLENLENSALATGLEKVSFHSKPKECSNYHTITLISHARKVMLKILQARLQQYVNQELPDVQVGFRKGRGPRDQIANIHWIIEKIREFQKNHILLLHWLCIKSLTIWITTSWKILQEMGIPDHLTCLLSYWMQVKKQQLEPDMEQQIDFKLGKEYIKAVYHHPDYLTYMQSILWEMLDWMKHKLESRLPGEIS